MAWTERPCLNCGKQMFRDHNAKYCLECSVDVARAKQAAWYKAYRLKQKLAKEVPKGSGT